jgi:hypothetical protein
LKEPGTKRLKVQYDEKLSIFAFKFNLRRYSEGREGRSDRGSQGGLGRAVQVDPIKPMLTPPGTQRLKLKYDDVLSNFRFKIDLRRYNSGMPPKAMGEFVKAVAAMRGRTYEAGAYTRTLFSTT